MKLFTVRNLGTAQATTATATAATRRVARERRVRIAPSQRKVDRLHLQQRLVARQQPSLQALLLDLWGRAAKIVQTARMSLSTALAQSQRAFAALQMVDALQLSAPALPPSPFLP